ncbi:MAG TPA: S41 family peptidase [Thermoanaerobaculia bacterium]|nr:S41 family peptidase [Thermoanaerobaculia bacterium]
MTKSRFLFFLASSLLVLPILAGSIVGAAVEEQAVPGGDSLYKYLSVFTETLGLVDQTYVEESDQGALLGAALDGMTDALDPLAVYVPEDAVAGYLQARDVGSGHSGLFLLRERGMIYTLAVRDGSPGAEAGIEEGDLVAEIDGRSTRVMPMWEIQKVLAGAPGTEVSLKVVRFAETRDATVTLRPFAVPAPALEMRDGVAVVSLAAIDRATPEGVRGLLERAREADADRLLLDLRGVAGGDAEAAYEVAGLFAGGDLGRLERRGEALQGYTGSEPFWTGRIVVLTNRATLGPAELLASVLRQKAAAETVGQRTFGYAGRQSMLELASGGVLFLADAFFTGPDFEPLDEPLEPDVRVDVRMRTFSQTEEGAGEDREVPDVVLEKGLELLRDSEPAVETAA